MIMMMITMIPVRFLQRRQRLTFSEYYIRIRIIISLNSSPKRILCCATTKSKQVSSVFISHYCCLLLYDNNDDNDDNDDNDGYDDYDDNDDNDNDNNMTIMIIMIRRF